MTESISRIWSLLTFIVYTFPVYYCHSQVSALYGALMKNAGNIRSTIKYAWEHISLIDGYSLNHQQYKTGTQKNEGGVESLEEK
jgi:hypothetical protein